MADCSDCDGSGLVLCRACLDSVDFCPECDGNGVLDCETCDGSGHLGPPEAEFDDDLYYGRKYGYG